MRGRYWRALAVLFLSTALIASASTAAGAEPEPSQPSTPTRVKDVTATDTQQAVAQPGGIKAAMTGGNTVYADVREEHPRADGYQHIDTPALIGKLRALGLNTYVYGIWDSPTDWDDLRNEFAPAAAAAGIKIWVYVVPPSECLDSPVAHQSGRCSRPYTLDFVRWAHEIATLSLQYRNIVSWAIDDFIVGANGELFTADYMRQIVESQDAVNPRLGFYTTAYFGEATNEDFYDRFAPYIDGIVYPYLGRNGNTQDPDAAIENVDKILRHTEPRGLGVLFLLYTGRFLDAALPPTEDYVAKTIENVMPYVRSGKLLGIDAYGLPMRDKPAPTADNRAAHGIGRFNVSLAAYVSTQSGDYAEARQRVRVNRKATRHELRFADFDWYYGNLGGSGHHVKQVLVDDAVAWESDVTDRGGQNYVERSVDLTEALRGKDSATLSLRVFDREGVTDFPLDVGFDDVRGSGFTVTDGGFESGGAWELAANTHALMPAFDRFTIDRPARIRAAVALAMRELPFPNPPPLPEWPKPGYRTDNRAMYGNGRLSLRVPEHTAIDPGHCASATREVRVDPSSPRYQLSFWDYDQYANSMAATNQLVKRVLVDGHQVYQRDIADVIEYTWMNGDPAQGTIDVSQFLEGRPSVALTFQLCTVGAVRDLGADVGVDTVESIGFDVGDPGFESGEGWQLTSTSPALIPKVEIIR